jgi:hypothetical protein
MRPNRPNTAPLLRHSGVGRNPVNKATTSEVMRHLEGGAFSYRWNAVKLGWLLDPGLRRDGATLLVVANVVKQSPGMVLRSW